MRSWHLSVGVVEGRGSISCEEGPAWLFAARWLFENFNSVGHLIADPIAFPQGTWLYDRWRTLGQLYCGRVCIPGSGALFRGFRHGSVDADLATLWTRLSAFPQDLAFMERELRGALGSTPEQYHRARSDDSVTAIPDLGISIAAARVEIEGRSYVPCSDCDGSGYAVRPARCPACVDRGYSDDEPECERCHDRIMIGAVECARCRLARVTLTDSWSEHVMTCAEADALDPARVRRYADTKAPRREDFSSGWVIAASTTGG